MQDRRLAPGTPVALYGGDEDVHLVRIPGEDDVVRIQGLGVLSADLFEDLAIGEVLQLGRRSVRVLPQTPDLVFMALARRAQIIGPQDAARIVHECGIGPGSTVVEGGLGSGALTCYMAHAVGPEGTIHGYELREDHAEVARANLEATGLIDRVEVHLEDLGKATGPCDAFIADVPDPETVLPAATRATRPGGRVCFYTPIVEQMEAVVRGLREGPFVRVRALEQLERGWVVHDRGARPSFEMLAHTGFLTLATRVADR